MMKSDTIGSAKIDWTKVDATTDAKIARQAQQDRTATISDRVWQEMARTERITLLLPTRVGM